MFAFEMSRCYTYGMEKQNLQLLRDALAAWDIPASEAQLDTLVSFYELVSDANSRFNLTAISDERDFVVKHLLDSASAVPLIGQGARLLDIGAGAGFPSLPLAVLREDISVTALDSTAKKMAFLSSSASSLGIENLTAVAGRAEEQTALFGTFDVVTARAVSSLNILLELAAPMLVTGGIFIAYKSDASELLSAQTALKTLKMRHISTTSLDIFGNSRALLSFRKLAPTPACYPRRYSLIKRSPL